MAVAASAAPAAEAEADPALIAAGLPYAAAAYHVAPTNCKVENEVLVTRNCAPRVEEVCSTETVETEEIEYEKACKDVEDTICDAPAVAAAIPAATIVKREAEADPQYLSYGLAAHAPLVAAAPVATAVAHTAVATVKHACRTVTTTHCVDNPKVKVVPVEVKHCSTVTKVACTDVENAIPKTTCEPVETTHVTGYGLNYAYGK